MMYDIIAKKRDGKELSEDEIHFFINGYTSSAVPDYQAAALLMAIYLNGMSLKETFALNDAMLKTGEMLDLQSVGSIVADKHSTGGVGDKTTLIVLPVCASLGLKVSKMSGRALGHTGGTIDKLESIKGFRTELTKDEFVKIIKEHGGAVTAQTKDLVLADKLLYALRDQTATIESIPLIATSIMSKKLALGADVIVLDVKYGSGAFMKTKEKATELADLMIAIGKNAGKMVDAVISDMNVPLGTHVGNSLEVLEAIDVLKGKGAKDLRDISITLSSKMLALAGIFDEKTANIKVEQALNDGSAYKKFEEIVRAQGGSMEIESAKNSFEIIANEGGYLDIDCENIGKTCLALGAGRTSIGGKIDHTAGIILDKKSGEYVKKGERIMTLFSSTKDIALAKEVLKYKFINTVCK